MPAVEGIAVRRHPNVFKLRWHQECCLVIPFEALLTALGILAEGETTWDCTFNCYGDETHASCWFSHDPAGTVEDKCV